ETQPGLFGHDGERNQCRARLRRSRLFQPLFLAQSRSVAWPLPRRPVARRDQSTGMTFLNPIQFAPAQVLRRACTTYSVVSVRYRSVKIAQMSCAGSIAPP